MTSPENRHYAKCIGALSFLMRYSELSSKQCKARESGRETKLKAITPVDLAQIVCPTAMTVSPGRLTFHRSAISRVVRQPIRPINHRTTATAGDADRASATLLVRPPHPTAGLDQTDSRVQMKVVG